MDSEDKRISVQYLTPVLDRLVTLPIFMKETGMFVEGIYEIPEVREIHPGHLVRSGNSSAYDINFGFEAGASAILLLLEGKTGVTVSNKARMLSEGVFISNMA